MILQTVNERDTHSRCQLRILAVRPRVDHRIVGIVVYIQNRCVGDVNSERPSLERGEATFLVSQYGVSGCTDCHLWREENGATKIDRVGNEVTPARPESGSCFQIRAEQKRNLAHRLQRVELRRDFRWRSD